MEIAYLGVNCLHIDTKGLSLLFDPYDDSYGLKKPGKKADVVIYSNLGADKEVYKARFVIDGPGEYEIKGVNIQGIAARLHTQGPDEPPKGVAYTVRYDDLTLLVLGNIAPELDEEQSEELGDPHIMVVPVGGHGLTLDKEAAAKLVSQFDPGFVIPTHFADKETKYPVPQDTVEAFLGEVGVEKPEEVEKLKVKRKDLPEETTVAVLKRQ